MNLDIEFEHTMVRIRLAASEYKRGNKGTIREENISGTVGDILL
jgi:hypothetical protein